MPYLHYSPKVEEEINNETARYCTDIYELIPKYKAGDRQRNQVAYDAFWEHIKNRRPLLVWDATDVNKFLLMALPLCRSDLIAKANGPITELEVASLLERSTWLCSAALNHIAVADFVRIQSIGLWIATVLNRGDTFIGPENFLEGLTQDFQKYGISKEDLLLQAKMQLIFWLITVSEKGGDPPFSIELAWEWSQDLLKNSLTVKLIKPVLGKLQQYSNNQKEKVIIARPTSEVNYQKLDEMGIWNPPILIENSEEELINFLKTIRDYVGITLRNSNSIQKLLVSGKLKENILAVIFVFKNLWRHYWENGNKLSLTYAEKCALLLLSLNKNVHVEKRKGQFLCQWMVTQFPGYIHTCDLNQIMEDGKKLILKFEDRENRPILLAGVVQAFTGEYNYFSKNNQRNLQKSLIVDNGHELQSIHEQYSKEVGEKDIEEEIPAWNIISIELSPVESNGSSITQKQFETELGKLPIQSVTDDPEFIDAVNSNLPEELLKYANRKFDTILVWLNRKLDIRIDIGSVIQPVEKVWQSGGASIKRPNHPDYDAGINALGKGNYEQGITCFSSLARQVYGKGSDIANNYLAYAYAKNGNPTSAIQELRQLSEADSDIFTVYWNYACCLPYEDNNTKLDILLKGIEKSPHYKLLLGIVSLYSVADPNHKNLFRFLPALTQTEALLWLYKLISDTTDKGEEDTLFNRIIAHKTHGEPTIPDPYLKIIPGSQIKQIIPVFIKKYNQPEVIDFWISCRDKSPARSRFEYIEFKTDYFLTTNKKEAAASSFLDEIEKRFNYYNVGEKNSNKPDESFINSTRNRIEKFLAICNNQELHKIGKQIFDRVLLFQKDHDGVVLIEQERQEYDSYRLLEKGNVNVNELIAQVGGRCRQKIQDHLHIELVRPDLDQLIIALTGNGAQKSANALQNLLKVWAQDLTNMKKNDKEELIKSCRSLLNEFKTTIQEELGAETSLIGALLFVALDRVNNSLARTFNLLPHITASTLNQEPAKFDSSVEKTSIPVLLSCTKKDPVVKITKVNAKLILDEGTEIELPLRDHINEFPPLLSPSSNVLLTLGINERMELQNPREVRLELSYEYSGATYNAEPISVQVQSNICPDLPEESPYIYGRQLLPAEIEQHFVGRDDEKKRILDSISNGQQKVYYIVGIRRIGKSSLLSAIENEIIKQGLPLIPIQLIPSSKDSGTFLYNIISTITKDPRVIAYKIKAPNKKACNDNPAEVYDNFQAQLLQKIPDKRVVILLDEFQELVQTAELVEKTDKGKADGFRKLLNYIRSKANPNARLLWVFSGYLTKNQYRKMFPLVSFWADMEDLKIDFLELKSIRDIVTKPLSGAEVYVPEETIQHIKVFTAGHPEVTQKIADITYKKMIQEKRQIITPADIEDAAICLAKTEDNFADSWYPLNFISKFQNEFMASFIDSVQIGDQIEPNRLVTGGILTDSEYYEIQDLIEKQILDNDDATFQKKSKIRIRSKILDLWLRENLRKWISSIETQGPVAVFIDCENLGGRDSKYISGLITDKGEDGEVGRFKTSTILSIIERYCRTLSPAPVIERRFSYNPPFSVLAHELLAHGYIPEPIPEALAKKGHGQDDKTLLDLIDRVCELFPRINHFVLVASDKDFSIKCKTLIERGKFVHVICREGRVAIKEIEGNYEYLKVLYPNNFSIKALEDLIGDYYPQSSGSENYQ